MAAFGDPVMLDVNLFTRTSHPNPASTRAMQFSHVVGMDGDSPIWSKHRLGENPKSELASLEVPSMVKSEDTRGLEYYLGHLVHLEVILLYVTLNLTICKGWKSKCRCIPFRQQRHTVVTKNFDPWHGSTNLQPSRCFEPPFMAMEISPRNLADHLIVFQEICRVLLLKKMLAVPYLTIHYF